MAKAATKAKQPQVQTITLPELAPGEVYAGIILENGQPAYHLILLPGHTQTNWKDATAWAKQQGGELPTRREQSLLFANAADQFQKDWYWSCEQHSGNSYYAWLQTFTNGDQYWSRRDDVTRARAVRRSVIQ